MLKIVTEVGDPSNLRCKYNLSNASDQECRLDKPVAEARSEADMTSLRAHKAARPKKASLLLSIGKARPT